MKLAAILAVSLFVLSACTSQTAEPDDDVQASATQGRDLTDSDANTDGVKGNENYVAYDIRRDSLTARGDVGGYGCTQDCSGHDAGWQWAEDHDISDASECGGKSWSFQEGCVAFAEKDEHDTAGEEGTVDQSEE